MTRLIDRGNFEFLDGFEKRVIVGVLKIEAFFFPLENMPDKCVESTNEKTEQGREGNGIECRMGFSIASAMRDEQVGKFSTRHL